MEPSSAPSYSLLFSKDYRLYTHTDSLFTLLVRIWLVKKSRKLASGFRP